MPDNAIYYKAAYAVLAALYLGYTLTIVLRRRALDARRARQAGGRA